ncbi:hypothetical protein MYK68_05360 [Gordonia sp. PP30]|uniref:hypothetical protein n=1 Tax=Gordonia sp. PP30 TaxID=2935861 RepID=UPI001FFFFE8C|nr:hypothetical protein [Gordonia sp. PP30]UQE76025.1 hypothetical protein MYK68_05360 [Gordonia sp. PP30]
MQTPSVRIIERISAELIAADPGRPWRVGVDGVCGAGKSTFARTLTAVIQGSGRPVVFIDSDGFHHTRARRYRQGRSSARGYYDDAYDFDSLASEVLRPLGPDGSRRYATKVHDLTSDEVITGATAVAAANSIVIFDATFIQRPELDGLWDDVLYLHSDESAAIARGVTRDADALGGEAAARIAFESRYMAACRIYLAERQPRSRASIVIDNTDPGRPVVERLNSRARQARFVV